MILKELTSLRDKGIHSNINNLECECNVDFIYSVKDHLSFIKLFETTVVICLIEHLKALEMFDNTNIKILFLLVTNYPVWIKL